MSKFNIMKNIDLFVFNNVEKVTKIPEYQKFVDFYSSWEEDLQTFLKLFLVTAAIGFPLFIAFIFYMINSSAKNELKTYENIITTASTIVSKSSSAQMQAIKFFGKNPLSTRTAFENELKNSLSAVGIDTAKISTANFDNKEDSGVNEVSAEIKFRELSAANFFSLLNTLTIKSKMKVDEINISKNKQTNLLEGTTKLLYFSQLQLDDLQ